MDDLDLDLNELRALIALCRETGVTVCKYAGVELVLGPSPALLRLPDADAQPTAPKDPDDALDDRLFPHRRFRSPSNA